MTPNFPSAWAETFRYARERSPFYRELFRGLKEAPPLDQVPLLDKKILSERNLDFLSVPQEQVVEIVTTSGTTGKPLLWMLSESDVRRLALNERLSFECAALTARDTVLVAVAMDRCFMAGLAYWLGLRELGCGVVRVGPSSPMLVLEMIERVQPTVIVAVPSFLKVISDKARETGFDLRGSSVKKAVCIGEPVRDMTLGTTRHTRHSRAAVSAATRPASVPDAAGTTAGGTPTGPSQAGRLRHYDAGATMYAMTFALNTAGAAIESAWGARVYSTYGVTELANSLCECEAGAGGHLHEQQLHLEVLDESGQPTPDGEVGEIVATTFGVEAMPVIRYRTGDCAALFRERCVCGRTTPRLGPIVGRKNQKLKFKGASLFPSTLQAVLEEAQGVEAFVIVARAENELSDTIEVLVHGDASIPALREALQARSRISPGIRHVSLAEIEALQLPPQARKRRTFVDLR